MLIDQQIGQLLIALARAEARREKLRRMEAPQMVIDLETANIHNKVRRCRELANRAFRIKRTAA